MDVRVWLDDGSVRGCIFATPEQLATCGSMLGDVRWHAPCGHLLVMGRLSEEVIEAALREVERQGDLVACTQYLDNEEPARAA